MKKQKPPSISTPLKLTLTSILFLTLSSCSVSPEHHVRKGIDPRYQDKNVAFRTTYYVRVFDHCGNKARRGSEIERESYKGIPIQDSLYRFRMTGKANTLLNKVRFESGTLKSWEIDPLGAAVIYDENIKRFRYVSQGETAETARQKKAMNEYLQLMKTYKELTNTKNTEGLHTIELLGKSLNYSLGKLSQDSFKSPDSIKGYNSAASTLIDENSSTLQTLNEGLHEELKKNVDKAAGNAYTQAIDLFRDDLTATLKDISIEKIHSAREKVIKEKIIQKSNSNEGDHLIDTPAITTINSSIENKIPISSEGAINNISDINNVYKKSVTDQNISPILKSINAKILGKGNYNTNIDDNESFKQLNNAYKDSYDRHVNEPKDSRATKIQDELKKEISALSMLSSEQIDELKAEIKATLKDVDSIQTYVQALATTRIRNAVQNASQKSVVDTFAKVEISTVPQGVLLTMQTAINNKLRIATGSEGSKVRYQDNDNDQTKKTDIDTKINCNDITKRRGFQILGPEGWKTFDPDDRLIMAMRTSSDPLISSLKQLSQRVLTAHKKKKPDILPAVQAQLSISKAQHELFKEEKNILPTDDNGETSPTDISEKICGLVNALNDIVLKDSSGKPADACGEK